jgi:PST family polysaccharide transporter
MAFFVSYVFHSLLNYAIVRWLSGFRFSMENLSAIFLTFLVAGGAFGSFFVFSHLVAMGVGALAVLVSGVYCFMQLATLVEPSDLPAPFRQLVSAARGLSRRRVH